MEVPFFKGPEMSVAAPNLLALADHLGEMLSTVAVEAAIRRDRGEQPLWVWLAVLTANNRLCTYCETKQAVTLEHETPLAGARGRDIWWNLVPACDRCNRWKGAKSAAAWKIDMEIEVPPLIWTA